MLIGREKEKAIFDAALTSDYSQFIAVYGRRRVGKTFLICEAFAYNFTFHFSGAANTSTKNQLIRFRQSLRSQGLKDVQQITTWIEAFGELERFITFLPKGKKVIFLDELPWMDAPKSHFVSALEAFWNGWASARRDIVLVVCGSSTSWMIKKIVKNKGGLYNRLNHRIALQPFTLRLCEKLTKAQGIKLSQKQLLEGYMIFGGVPYYWSLLRKGASLSQEIDRLIFAEDGELHNEFNMLYAALFSRPEPYLKIIDVLAHNKTGLTRQQLIDEGDLASCGRLSTILADLEWCGFIRSYAAMGKRSNGFTYQLIDHFTLFYYAFIHRHRQPSNFWQSTENTPKRNTWRGLAFEKVCLWHIDEIKQKLGIQGVLTNVYSWSCQADKELGVKGSQIDLVLDRQDGIVDLCEIKYAKNSYAITEKYAAELSRKSEAFSTTTKTKKAIHTVMITTDGLRYNEYSGEIQNALELKDLF